MLVILAVRNQGGRGVDEGDAAGVAPEIGRWIFASDVPDARRQTEAADVPLVAQWLGARKWLAPGRYEIGAAPGAGESTYIVLVS